MSAPSTTSSGINQNDVSKIRDKYLSLKSQKGSNFAITELHKEMNLLERKVFDGGFDKDRLELLQSLREISRELWTEQFKE
jgi:hypothetical protein